MEIELAPAHLLPEVIEVIAKSAVTCNGIPTHEAINLIRHIEWQADEIERLSEELDAARDTIGSSRMVSRAKRAADELADVRGMMDDIRTLLGIPADADPVAAVRSALRRAGQSSNG